MVRVTKDWWGEEGPMMLRKLINLNYQLAKSPSSCVINKLSSFTSPFRSHYFRPGIGRDDGHNEMGRGALSVPGSLALGGMTGPGRHQHCFPPTWRSRKWD